MNKIDEIRYRANTTDNGVSLVMPWERDDFNYLLAEIERLKGLVQRLVRVGRNVEPILPTDVGRVSLETLYDIAEFRSLLLQAEASGEY